MDVSVLRQRYRTCRDRQRRTAPQLVRTDSTGPSDAVSMVPVAQGWTSPWEPANSPFLPVVTFDPDRKTSDPWRVHLDLHRRCHPALGLQGEPRSCRSSSSEVTSCIRTQEHGSGSSGSGLGSTSRTPERDPQQPEVRFTGPHQKQDQNPSEGTSSFYQQLGSGAGSGSCQNQNPFPSRRNLKISESARRLGLYPSS